MKRTHTTLLASVILSSFITPQASAYSFLQTPDGNELKWRTLPITYQIGPLSKDLDEGQQIEAIHRAFDTWAHVEGVELIFEFEGFAEKGVSENDGANIIYFVNSGWDPESRAIATTNNLAYTSGEVHGFDLPLNDEEYTFTATDDPDMIQTDIQNTITHEIGHVLGLSHSEDIEATMYTSTGLGDITKRDLSQDDTLGLQALYKDGDFLYQDDSVAGCGCSQGEDNSAGGLASLVLAGGLIGAFRRRRPTLL